MMSRFPPKQEHPPRSQHGARFPRKIVKKLVFGRVVNEPKLKPRDLIPLIEQKLKGRRKNGITNIIENLVQQYGVSRRGLFEAWHNHLSHPPRHHGNDLLQDSEEEMWIGVIRAFRKACRPLHQNEFGELIREYHGFDKSWNAASFVQSFLKRRRKDVSSVFAKKISHRRTIPEVKEECKEFAKEYSDLLDTFKINPSCQINFDEYELRDRDEADDFYVLVDADAPQVNEVRTKSKYLGTLIPVFSGNELLAIFEILKSDVSEKPESGVFVNITKTHTRRDHSHPYVPLYYVTNDTGKSNAKIIVQLLKIVKNIMKERQPGLHCMVIMDGCNVHRAKIVLDWCKENTDFHVFYLPSNSTYFTQPCDNLIFRVLARGTQHYLHCERGGMIIGLDKNVNEDLSLLYQDAIMSTLRNLITPKVIEESWRNVHLVEEDGYFSKKEYLSYVDTVICSDEVSSNRKSDRASMEKIVTHQIVKNFNPSLGKKNPGKTVLLQPNRIYDAELINKQEDEAMVVKQKEKDLADLQKVQKQTKAYAEEVQRQLKRDEAQRKANALALLKLKRKQEREAQKAKVAQRLTLKKQNNQCKGCSLFYRRGWKWTISECKKHFLCKQCDPSGRKVKMHERACEACQKALNQ
jgi:DDE superfamily endonuclease